MIGCLIGLGACRILGFASDGDRVNGRLQRRGRFGKRVVDSPSSVKVMERRGAYSCSAIRFRRAALQCCINTSCLNDQTTGI